MISNATENVMLANVIVAAATVDNTARALSTVASPTQVPTSTPTAKRAPMKATKTATAGSTKKLDRIESATPRRRSTPSTVRPDGWQHRPDVTGEAFCSGSSSPGGVRPPSEATRPAGGRSDH